MICSSLNRFRFMRSVGWILPHRLQFRPVYFSGSRSPAFRNGTEALQFAQSAIAVSSPNDHVTADVLAAALAETGAFDKALAVLVTAIQSAGHSARLEAMKRHRAVYALKQPWRE